MPVSAPALSREAQPVALVPGLAQPPTTTKPAMPASTELRNSVSGPAGAERSWPKQWQRGARPRLIAEPMATMNPPSSTRAPTAPQRAEPRTTSATETASSPSGNEIPRRGASGCGIPNSRTARREPAGSANLANPATANTTARTIRALRSAPFTGTRRLGGPSSARTWHAPSVRSPALPGATLGEAVPYASRRGHEGESAVPPGHLSDPGSPRSLGRGHRTPAQRLRAGTSRLPHARPRSFCGAQPSR